MTSHGSLMSTDDLRRLRRLVGLTQKQLADKAGVSQSLIARIERGTVDPRYSTFRKIIAALSPMESSRTARDIMSSPVECISCQESVRAAVDKMKRTGFSQLPVLMDGRIVGSMHESTILERIAKSSSPERVLSNSVYNLMDKPFQTITPNESIEKVVNLLSSGAPALLVVDNDLLLGIITKIDVLALGMGQRR